MDVLNYVDSSFQLLECSVNDGELIVAELKRNETVELVEGPSTVKQVGKFKLISEAQTCKIQSNNISLALKHSAVSKNTHIIERIFNKASGELVDSANLIACISNIQYGIKGCVNLIEIYDTYCKHVTDKLTNSSTDDIMSLLPRLDEILLIYKSDEAKKTDCTNTVATATTQSEVQAEVIYQQSNDVKSIFLPIVSEAQFCAVQNTFITLLVPTVAKSGFYRPDDLTVILLRVNDVNDLLKSFPTVYAEVTGDSIDTANEHPLSLFCIKQTFEQCSKKLQWRPSSELFDSELSSSLAEFILSNNNLVLQLARCIFHMPVGQPIENANLYSFVKYLLDPISLAKSMELKLQFSKFNYYKTIIYNCLNVEAASVKQELLYLNSYHYNLPYSKTLTDLINVISMNLKAVSLTYLLERLKDNNITFSQVEEDFKHYITRLNSIVKKDDLISLFYNYLTPYGSSLAFSSLLKNFPINESIDDYTQSLMQILLWPFSITCECSVESAKAVSELRQKCTQQDMLKLSTSLIVHFDQLQLAQNPVNRLRQLYRLNSSYTLFDINLYLNDLMGNDKINEQIDSSMAVSNLVSKNLIYAKGKYNNKSLNLLIQSPD